MLKMLKSVIMIQKVNIKLQKKEKKETNINNILKNRLHFVTICCIIRTRDKYVANLPTNLHTKKWVTENHNSGIKEATARTHLLLLLLTESGS